MQSLAAIAVPAIVVGTVSTSLTEGIPGIATGVGTLGAVGWVVWYLLAKVIPGLTEKHESAINTLVADQREERKLHREERKELAAAIDRNTDATEKLADAVDRKGA